MRQVIIIRPEPGATATLAAGAAIGLEMVAIPTWEVVARSWSAPDPAIIDALLIGSANGLRHAGAQHGLFATYPVHAVGRATAALAGHMGHPIAQVGEGGLQAVIDALGPPKVHLLRLAGAAHAALVLPPHVTVTTRIVYETRPLPCGTKLGLMLRRGALVLLHSAAAARHFAAEVDRLALSRDRIALAALAPAIALAAGTGWADCRVAASPDDAALLALVDKMCH